MRIIAGLHRSRTILGPDGEHTTRPITDRVKQSLFDRLWAMGVFENQPLNILDIFAGTGSLGLEALSRALLNDGHTAHCTFIERDRSARQRLETNLVELNLTPHATVRSSDALAGSLITLLHAPIHLIMLDPPYQMVADPESALRIAHLLDSLHTVAAPSSGEFSGTTAMLRAPTDTPPPEISPDHWIATESYPYGGMTLHFYNAK